jgi:c-di-GMP-binding flagellar brake protein YcgR
MLEGMILCTAKVTERRQHPRAKRTFPVFAETHRTLISGTTKDISAGGAFICCQQPLKSGEVFELLISVSLRNPPIRAIAEVVRSHNSCPENEPEPHGMAVQFIIIPEADRRAISTMVAKHATRFFQLVL